MDSIIKRDCNDYLSNIDLSPLHDKNVIITGANGLIGTYLIYFLHLANLTKGLNIKIIGVSRNHPHARLIEIFKNRYHFYATDLVNINSIESWEKADYIIHGAGYAQPGKFLNNPLASMRLNTNTTDALLSKAVSDKARFLYLSSSEIYGDPDSAHIPTCEDYAGSCSPIEPRSCYSESKRMGETFCYAYKETHGLDVKIARISITYGPGVDINDERVIGNFLKMALIDGEIRMLDQGGQIRTFCYVSDCVLMLLNILLYGKDFVYNVGGKDAKSILELAQEICMLTNSKLIIPTEANNRLNAPSRVELNIDRICKEFEVVPFVSLRDGLKRTIEWNRR
ncbi:MAG: NAD-dependent epimerase/dehydratase family protein [Syntrophomonas sp.]